MNWGLLRPFPGKHPENRAKMGLEGVEQTCFEVISAGFCEKIRILGLADLLHAFVQRFPKFYQFRSALSRDTVRLAYETARPQ